ncbi:MAG: hypothetical protein LBQ88_11740, partial [Treponema sp.]|nr:hypothetical protein [Treponema sp.]
AGEDLIPGKIHTLRKNHEYWKRWDGKEVSIRTWEGKPYRSRQREVKRVVIGVQRTVKIKNYFYKEAGVCDLVYLAPLETIAKNDGLTTDEFCEWFKDYPDGDMAILHFTDFQY